MDKYDSSLPESPERKVGRIDLIVEKICKNLTPNDLLAARLVCKRWLKEATKSALQRQCLKAKVPLMNGTDAVQVFAEVTESSTFPTNAFQWDLYEFGLAFGEYFRPGRVFLSAAWVLGKGPKTLRTVLNKTKCLILASSWSRLNDDSACLFWNALGDNSHIEELHYGVQGLRTYPGAICQPSLPNLHTVVVHPAETGLDLTDLERILKGAPNLKTLSGCTPRFLRMIHRAEKTACVKRLELPKLDTTNVDVLQFCMDSGFKFEEVSFAFGERSRLDSIRPRVNQDLIQNLQGRIREMQLEPLVEERMEMDLDEFDRIIRQGDVARVAVHVVNVNPADRLEQTLGAFLVFNRSSLESVKAPSLHAVNAVLTEDVKIFTALRTLHLCDPKSLDHNNAAEIDKVEALLPVGVNLSFVFPNLETVVLDLKALVPDYLKLYFPDDDLEPGGNIHPITSVKTLIVKCRYDNDGMDFLAKKFPNLKHVTIYQVIGSYAHGLSSAVWRLPKDLQTVTFHFRIKSLNLKIKKLDDLLLGLRREEYGPLEKAMEEGKLNVDVLKNTRYMRVDRVAITRLKQLKELKIILDTDEDLQPLLKRSERKSRKAQMVKEAKEKIERKKLTDFFIHSQMISPTCAFLSTGMMKETKFVVEFDGDGQYAEGILERLGHLKPYFEFVGTLKSYDYTDD